MGHQYINQGPRVLEMSGAYDSKQAPQPIETPAF